ncbi:MAG TPA: hypothetical protein EYO01_06920 [Phycisphaerales bacterium]|nr:hypothetical protein [Phycisphaerales bacterium]
MRTNTFFIGAVTLVCTATSFSETINVPNDFPSIQDAISAAESGDVIQVEAGTYSESIDFLGKTITVTSVSGSSNTIIDGGGTGVVVSFITGETNKSLLDGFTLQFGSALRGAGVYISEASPYIKNCLLKSNQATLSGGAMYVIASNVKLENIVFEGNVAGDAGGAIYLRDSSATISGGSMLSNSSTNGGAMYVKDRTGLVLMDGVTFRQNSATVNGGGIYVKNSEVIATDCIFDLNSANDGGAWFSYYGGDATITNGVFNDNIALGLGGAANVRSNSTVSFLQCTFESNVADSDCDTIGGGAVLNIVNSIVTLEDPSVCYNLLCDSEDLFSGDAPIIVGEILDCSSSDDPGACCGGSACWEMVEADCIDGGGAWNGNGSVCGGVTCDGGTGSETGACCVEDNCVQATELSCVDAEGVFYGTTVTCVATECPATCDADVNGDGIVNVSDLLALISVWGMCP